MIGTIVYLLKGQKMKVGNLVRLEYNGRIRVGRIQKITDKYIRVFIGDGKYRTFTLDKIFGLIIIGCDE